MARTTGAIAIVMAARPFTPGPASAIRYDVKVQSDDGRVFEMLDVGSNLIVYPDAVACTPAPVGSEHEAHISGDRLTLFIPPIPVTVTCEDIE